MITIKELENAVRSDSFAIMAFIEQAKKTDPVAANNIFKGMLQYMRDKAESIGLKNVFTVQELEDLGYLPKAY